MKIIAHGGTAVHESDNELEKQDSLERAIQAGQAVLEGGGEAVEAVVQTIVLLEDSGLFTAGCGSQSQLDGVFRYDASLMSSERQAGAVVGLRAAKNPILAAEVVMKEISHTTLVGEVASKLLVDGFALNSVEEPTTESRSAASIIQQYREGNAKMFGTVGAVAVDSAGRIAAGTSSGGYPTAFPGRTGDSAAIGIGTVATGRCGVSCTGDGDRILLGGIATAIDAYIDAGMEPQAAADKALCRMGDNDAMGGFIMVLPTGDVIVRANVKVIRTCESVEE